MNNISKAIAAELQHEAANTTKMLELISPEHFTFKPHEKSMPFGRLASHVAELAGWVGMTINTEELDLAGGYQLPKPTTREELLQMHGENVANALKALESATDEHLLQPWTLRRGDHVILQLPRVAVIRSMCMNHMIHHRGQLSVYMRLNDVPLPGIYGPTADEHVATADAQKN